MSDFSRRQFLKQLGVFATTLAVCPNMLANNDSFEMLVVGDSLIWGQGLLEKDKTYSLVQNWLQNDLKKRVKLKVKAHSGATIFLHDKEKNLLKNANKDEIKNLLPEVSVGFPTISKQIENAKLEYETVGTKPEDVNLVLLTAGIVDITVAGVLDPFAKNDELKKLIIKYCRDDLFQFLEHSATIFPNALFVVVGYFPIVSPDSNSSEMLNAFLETQKFLRIIKPFINNNLGKQFFKKLKKKALARSRIWFEDSNREMQGAVNHLNEKFGKPRAIFVKSNFTENDAVHTDNTLLFEMDKKGKINDPQYQQRAIDCKKVLADLKREINLKQSVRLCEMAAIGHPNIEGAKRYAEAIINNLKQNYKL